MIEDIDSPECGKYAVGRWDLKMDTKLTKIWTSSGGSIFDQKNPMIKCEFLFNKETDIQLIMDGVRAILNRLSST